MNAEVFHVTFDEVQKYDWQSILDKIDSNLPGRDTASGVLYQKALALHDAGDKLGERVFSFLAAITSLSPNFESTEIPFSPRYSTSTSRSAALEDFTKDSALVLAKLATVVGNTEIKAHFADVSSVLKFDHVQVQVAAYAYLDTARLRESCEDWFFFISDVERAAQLAFRLGRKQKPFQDVMQYADELIAKFAPTESGLCCSKLLGILKKYAHGDSLANAKVSESIAERFEANISSAFSLSYWKLAADLYRIEGKNIEHQRCAIRAAETHVLDAEAAIKSANPSFMASSSHLSHAVEALRRANAPKERIDEVHRMLLEHQKHVHKEMGSFGPQVEITPIQEQARKHVEGRSFPESILLMISGVDVIDVISHRKSIEKMANENPLLAMIGSSKVERDGRVVGCRPSMFTNDPQQYQSAVWTEMIHQAAMLHLPFRVQSYIDPCRMQIWREHHPRIGDLSFLIENQPFIPHGHEFSFARGFHAGFEGDWHAAAYYLVPQVENSIRYLLDRHNVITSKLDNKLIQEVRILDKLLSLPETTELLGEGHLFELRCILTEEFGSNLRNRLAHGLLADGDCYSPATQLLWWLLLRLCVIPLVKQEFIEPAGNNSSNEDGSD
ncbi:DUF4209 domain-containing protein [Prosthecobacter fluviatilis]|uniref:DUF4209 domain-containing protein n=1 Tax=Prosthecobacter fluviatilis TaxID=445931 RepID=A0ABW0KUG7_9BACT